MLCLVIQRLQKIQKELIDKFVEEDEEEEKIKKGIEKTKVDNEDIDTSSETSNDNDKNEDIDTSPETSNDNDKKEEKQVNYMDILKHIIPLICLLTIHDKETSFVEMFELIENE